MRGKEKMPSTNPWRRGDWSGERLTNDGTSTEDFWVKNDYWSDDSYAGAEALLYVYESGDRWDGDVAGIVLLTDGRYVSWECFYGPTGDGFCRDAYGGEAEIYFSSTLETALRTISEKVRPHLLAVCADES